MQEALRFTESNRIKASQRREFITSIEGERAVRRHAYTNQQPLSKAQLDTITDAAVGRDGRFKLAVSNEQWGTRLATLYGVMDLVASSRETNGLLRAILVELRRMNAHQ